MQKQIVLQTAEVCLQDKPKICLIQGPPGKNILHQRKPFMSFLIIITSYLTFTSPILFSGTGKTHVIESLVMHLLYRDRMYSRANRERGLVPRILLCAPSNNAVDLLVARLLRRRAKLESKYIIKLLFFFFLF